MGKISIIIPTLGRNSLYPLIGKLLEQRINEDFEIVLIAQTTLNEFLLQDKRIKIFYEPKGLGFAYYRNLGAKLSSGQILVFIDDDELPRSKNWLNTITFPIRFFSEKIVTAGVKIKLNQGYITDCISLLGFPGGGAIGYKVIWLVDENSYTNHLCTGNLAILKSTLKKVSSFSNSLKYGSEDVDLADKVIKKGYKIRYLQSATVYHVPRKLINFISWNYLRGKSASRYLKGFRNKKINSRFNSSLRVIKLIAKNKPAYLPGVIFAMANQYFWQGCGLIGGKLYG